MPRNIYVRPLNGRKIDDPTSGQRVPPEGLEVEDSPFWRARVKAEEVELVKNPPKLPEASPRAAEPVESRPESAAAKKGNK